MVHQQPVLISMKRLARCKEVAGPNNKFEETEVAPKQFEIQRLISIHRCDHSTRYLCSATIKEKSRMKQKLFVLLLMLVLTSLVFSACGSAAPAAPATKAPAAAAEEPMKIAFFVSD